MSQQREGDAMVVLALGVAGLVVGLARGGRLANLALLELRWGGLAILALVIQFVVVHRLMPDPSVSLDLAGALFLVTYLTILVVVWRNRLLPGIWLVGVGVLLNVLATLPHGGLMPTTPDVLQFAGRPVPNQLPGPGERPYVISKDLVLPQEQIPLWLIADRFALPRGWPGAGVFSPGDLAVGVGVGWLLAAGVAERQRVRDAVPHGQPVDRG